MEFRKELPMPVRGKPKGAGWFSVFVQDEWSPPQYRSADFPWRHDVEWHVELHIDTDTLLSDGLDCIAPLPVPGEVAKCCRELRTYMAKRKLAPWLHNLTAKICDWVDSLTPPREEPQPDPNSLPADEVERIHKLLDGHVPRADGTTCDDSGCQSKLYHRVHLLLEKSPQPVPEHVKATIGNLRSLMSKGEPCGYWYVQVLCDHILPREEPQPLPLPEQRRGTYEGVPCVASKSIHNDRTWWVQFRTKDGYPTDQFLTENCRELKLDGAADE